LLTIPPGPPGTQNGTLVGDANLLFGHAIGGNDTLSTDSAYPMFPVIIGDALTITGHAQGGKPVHAISKKEVDDAREAVSVDVAS